MLGNLKLCVLVIFHAPWIVNEYGSVGQYGPWVGATDSRQEGHFKWLNDVSVPQGMFMQGEPSSNGKTGSSAENCVNIYTDKRGLNDTPCSSKYGSICKACGTLPNCEMAICDSGFSSIQNQKCKKCKDNFFYYKPSSDERICEQMCAWNNHYCWPGKCGNDVTTNCNCAPGFTLAANNSLETLCQPSTKPSILTCDTIANGPKGEKRRAQSNSSSTACDYLTDFYGNFQPSSVKLDFLAEFTVDISALTKPTFINESNFGVTDTAVHIKWKSISGTDVHATTHALLTDTSDSDHVKQQSSSSRNMSISYTLKNGESLCLQYEAKGGGYLKKVDTRTSNHIVSGPVPYQKTVSTRDICYRFDDAAPEHCQETRNCSDDPLQLDSRISRSGIFFMAISGWFDPIPVNGSPVHTSGIESYEIRVNEVARSNDTLKVGTGIVYTKKLNKTETNLTLNLTSVNPKLYCITLVVKDVADNVKQARRFVLYDKTSFIQTREDKPFVVTSASSATNHDWQIHHNDICLSWKDHFYNKLYFDNPLLNPIAPDPMINGVYEQLNGILPISGTPNVYGILSYVLFWSLNDVADSHKLSVQNFQNQTVCHQFNITDGQTYTLNVEAVDILNNSFTENRTVHIDRSLSHINNIWLMKDGYKRIYVHSSTDLSIMQLYFETRDPHSGIKIIEWKFGISDSGTELATGSLGVGIIKETNCTGSTERCYCPDVGSCEIYNYTIPLNTLESSNKHTGNHNRNYFFTIKVTNHAMLSNTEHVDILVDESPPEPGVVIEGSVDGPDIDFTSDDSVMVNWRGFIDHESGIKFYRVALAPHCLDKEALYNINDTESDFEHREVLFPENSVRMHANFTGKMFVTVVALNNAMNPSMAVCSDGITKDNTAPEIRNVTLQHGRWSESVICRNGIPWLLHSSLEIIRLSSTSSCMELCSYDSTSQTIPSILPVNRVDETDKDKSDFMCERLPLYMPNNSIYIPNDHIYISWDIKEDGSQIEDFFVGFGTDSTEEAAPSLVTYTSTERKQYFKRSHEGIGTDELFYIFIKAINKAGLEKITAIGPVLIDETPPHYKSVPNVNIKDGNIVIGWQTDTFYDTKQKSQINQIVFQIEHDNKKVTPLLEWRLDSSKPCPGFSGGCFKYPLQRLQTQDTDLGLDFFVSLYIYNNAGHFTKINTPTFKLPSTYPPGHAVVLDIDPSFIADDSMNLDINVHFTTNRLCARWSGFKHHESVSLELGVGTTDIVDNIVPFYQINNTESECITSLKIVSGVKYFVLIRSNCSGGETLSSSNGITIWSETVLLSSLNVRVGQDCYNKPSLIEDILNISVSKLEFHSTVSLEIGMLYHTYVTNGMISNLLLSSPEAMVYMVNKLPFSYFEFIPKTVRPKLVFKTTNSSVTGAVWIRIVKCHNPTFLLPTNILPVYWFNNSTSIPSVSYEATVISSRNNSSLSNFFEKTVSNTSYIFKNIQLLPKENYEIAVRPCTKLQCMRSVRSDSFQIEYFPPTGTITSSNLMLSEDRSCYDIHLRWNEFNAESGITFYQWAVSTDSEADNLLLDWKTAADARSPSYSMSECIKVPVHPHARMFACVRAFSKAGHIGVNCQNIQVTYVSPYRRDVVYDFDSSLASWNDILEIISSSNAGIKYTQLHGADLDFGTSSSIVTGALMYASEREVAWYLMTSPHISDTCSSDKECVKVSITNTGYVTFDPETVHLDTFYYICAYSNSTLVEREQNTETLEELNACSDGFVLDMTPPLEGAIHVANTDGYLTDLSAISISWNGFVDNVDATKLGYADTIQSYSYAIGSRQGGDDIKRFTGVGLSTSVIDRNTNIADGESIYVSIMATDHSGLSTTITSKELMVDTTAPSVGRIQADDGFLNNIYTNGDSVSIRAIGYTDKESGIARFEIGIGSQPDIADIMSLSTYYDGQIELLLHGELYDGHTYYIVIKAVNRAGLVSGLSSVEFKVDKTPPTGGHVMDGLWQNEKDADYQQDLSSISGHWKGLMDPHSGIDYYKAGVGTRPYQDDVEPIVDVGLRTETTWYGSFIPGQKYYITVEACNRAGLCTTRSSDGIILDNSPPIPGLVRVGSDRAHQKYQSHTSSIHIQWVGFEDPQSSISHFEACIGTRPKVCDIKPYFPCLLNSNIIQTGLSLPVNTHLYATVKAYNKVGMQISQSSDAFIVDNSPPVVVSTPAFLLAVNNTVLGKSSQWERSVLSVFWKYEDKDSPIIKHIVTLKTHHEGHTPVENVELGSENTLTINLDGNNWLHNGDTYYVIVTCCNAAGLCSSENSSSLLIDSTPPYIGGFKPPMSWNNFKDSFGKLKSRISLTWYGFNDAESGIDLFYITIGRSYSSHDLTHGEVITSYNESLTDQSTQFTLEEYIRPNEVLFITIWARNTVGLNSSIARISVNAFSTIADTRDISKDKGTLEIEKHSCDIHFCNMDCTCAALGKKCSIGALNIKCRPSNTSETEAKGFPKVVVHGGLPEHQTDITASSSCLSANWNILPIYGSNITIQRYEWSMGIMNQPEGEGIFDVPKEQPWHDIGLGTKVVHCLPVNRTLEHDTYYVIYVKAWYGPDQFEVFISHSIKVDHFPPSANRGKMIKDSDALCKKDFDFIDWMDTITACWDGVFSEQQGGIIHYTVALGTSLKADDVYPTTNVGLSTSLTVNNVTLVHGTHYYFTVSAFNNVGLHTTLSSDGFVIDMNTPVAGVVFNTDRHRDERYQTSDTSFSLSWHGFVDHFSGIKSYFAAIVGEENVNSTNIVFTVVGLQTRVTFTRLNLEHSKTYYGLVKAYDGAGHVSAVSVSRGKTIDKTPPDGFACHSYRAIENQTDFFSGTKDNLVTIHHHFKRNYVYKVYGELQTTDANVRVLFSINRLQMKLPLILNNYGSRQLEYHFISPLAGVHNLTFNILSESNTSTTVYLAECTTLSPDAASAVQVQQIGESLLAVTVLIMDKESSLYKVEVGVGTTPGGLQVRPLSQIRGGNSEVLRVDVQHGSPAYVTVIAENQAGLRSAFHSRPVIMDQTAPTLHNVSAKIRLLTAHLDNDTTETEHKVSVDTTWKVEDNESGVKDCYCALGSHNGTSDIISYLLAEKNSCLSPSLSLSHGATIFVTVRCVNNIELAIDVTSHHVTVSIERSNINHTTLSFVPPDTYVSQYKAANHGRNELNDGRTHESVFLQSNDTCVQFQWSHFIDFSGIQHYEYRLMQHETPIVDWTNADRRQLVAIQGLKLLSGNVYTAEVRAVNSGNYISDTISANVFVYSNKPELSGSPLKITTKVDTIHVDWNGVFNVNHDIPASYSLTIGSREGHNDVIDVPHTVAQTHDVPVPESNYVANLSELFISITCTYSTGMFNTYTTVQHVT